MADPVQGFWAKGPCSWFGGPDDDGVDPDEGLAFFYEYSDAPHLFLDEQPPGTTGLARRLDPRTMYVACRWDYAVTPKEMLSSVELQAMVRAGGKEFLAYPADWGPHEDTGRAADISPGLMEALGITTDDEVEVIYPFAVEAKMRIAISSGHGRHIRGASGILDEVKEARRVAERVAELLRSRGTEVHTFHDNESDDQAENLERIADWHNETAFGGAAHDWDISVHFNAFEPTTKPMGVEVLYVTQPDMAARLSAAIAEASGLPDRGAKMRDDLYFLNQTEEKSLLLEICFVDSEADAEAYEENFGDICQAIAEVLA